MFTPCKSVRASRQALKTSDADRGLVRQPALGTFEPRPDPAFGRRRQAKAPAHEGSASRNRENRARRADPPPDRTHAVPPDLPPAAPRSHAMMSGNRVWNGVAPQRIAPQVPRRTGRALIFPPSRNVCDQTLDRWAIRPSDRRHISGSQAPIPDARNGVATGMRGFLAFGVA